MDTLYFSAERQEVQPMDIVKMVSFEKFIHFQGLLKNSVMRAIYMCLIEGDDIKFANTVLIYTGFTIAIPGGGGYTIVDY